MLRILTVSLILLFAGCTTSKPVTVTKIQLVSPQIPAALLSCPPSPAIPAVTSQAVVARYIVALWRAGMVCRNHLDAIKKSISTPSSPEH